MEAGESVMVSAHTSAGKTVVAEYAIAMALRDGQGAANKQGLRVYTAWVIGSSVYHRV